jgi:SOS-response transcriptional repressor LexA
LKSVKEKMKSAKNIEGEQFDLIRKTAGLSYKEFGKTLGLSESHVSNIIHGTRALSRAVLYKLREVYDADLNQVARHGYSPAAHSEQTTYIELVKQEAAAGSGVEIYDYAKTETIAVPSRLVAPYNPAFVQAVIVRGDSMTGEKIFDGDIVLFTRQVTEGENIFAVSVANTLLVKRVVRDTLAKTITLLSANPAYPPRIIAGADTENVKIEGKVIVNLHKM